MLALKALWLWFFLCVPSCPLWLKFYPHSSVWRELQIERWQAYAWSSWSMAANTATHVAHPRSFSMKKLGIFL
jgi:hypothetical protein